MDYDATAVFLFARRLWGSGGGGGVSPAGVPVLFRGGLFFRCPLVFNVQHAEGVSSLDFFFAFRRKAAARIGTRRKRAKCNQKRRGRLAMFCS